MKKATLSLFAVLALFVISCKKESSNGNQTGEIKGTWNLVNFDVDGTTSSEISSADIGSVKAVFLIDYTSVNNKGTLTIDDANMTSNALAYDVNGTINIKQYYNGLLISDDDSTFNVSVAPTTSTTAYTRVGSDSLYCPNGSFIVDADNNEWASKPAGIKYRFEGNKLIMTITQKGSEVQTQDGVTQQDEMDMKLIATFQQP
jgi:hypothetical protein